MNRGKSQSAKTLIGLIVLFVLSFIIFAAFAAPPVHAAGLTVDHIGGTDSGNCQSPPGCKTLRFAISQANNGDTITIVTHGSPDVFTENLTIDKNLSILGSVGNPSLVVIDGNGNVTNQRVITIAVAITATLQGITIRNGRLSADAGAGIDNENFSSLMLNSVVITGNNAISTTAADAGGGIINRGYLTVTNSIISNNSAFRGGGIFNAGGATMMLSGTVLSGNTATQDAGAFENYGSFVSLTNVTLDSNVALSYAGAIYNQPGFPITILNSTISNNSSLSAGGIDNLGVMTLTNVTLSGNKATSNTGGGIWNNGTIVANNITLDLNSTDQGDSGGAVFNSGGTFTITNSIVANSASLTNCNLASPLTSLGYNLSSDASCNFTATGDISSTNPLLGPLGNYSGSTKTHPLWTGSPAINGGNPATADGLSNHCVPTDQRGKSRNGRCDIGAFEGPLYPLFLPFIRR